MLLDKQHFMKPKYHKQYRKGCLLTNREKEVLMLIAYENTNSEIANQLFVSEGTVATHRNNLLAKLQTKNTAGMVRKAFELGILILNASQEVILKKDTPYRPPLNKLD